MTSQSRVDHTRAPDNARDTALVLSGGGINGVMMELGFLQRIRESPIWPRVACIFGTSAGALAGSMAALDRFDDLERFLVELQPADVFRPNRLWRLPLIGTHEYELPRTIAERLDRVEDMAEQLTSSPIELVVCATDISDQSAGADPRDWELVYSSRTSEPAELGQAILASAAISGLVPPLRVGDHVATDGGWTRNFPLGHANDRPEVELIVAFRYVPRYTRLDIAGLVKLRRRLERFGRVPPVRALVAELSEAEERDRRGEPPHAVDTLLRLMRVAVVHNTDLEERLAQQKDQSIEELARLRQDVAALLRRRPRLAREVDERFTSARFPFRHDRLVPRVIVRGSADELSLEAGRRTQRHWTREDKLALIRRGYELTDSELERHGLSSPAAA